MTTASSPYSLCALSSASLSEAPPANSRLYAVARAGRAGHATAYAGYQIIRRNGAVVSFEPHKIAVALMKAFLAVHGTQGAASASVRETVDALTETVVRALLRSRPGGGTFHIEDVQDQVELGLMRGEHHEVARAYVLYRERRAQERARQAKPVQTAPAVTMVTDGGQRVPLDSAAAGTRPVMPSAPTPARHWLLILYVAQMAPLNRGVKPDVLPSLFCDPLMEGSPALSMRPFCSASEPKTSSLLLMRPAASNSMPSVWRSPLSK